MADTTKLTYVVDTFDQDNMVLLVSFPDDGTTANIGIKTIPTTQAELDAIVKPFATHQEVVENIAAVKTLDLSFLKGIVGKKKTTTRFSAADAAASTQALIEATGASQATVPLPSNEVVLGDPEAAELGKVHDAAADKEYIKSLIKEVLAEQAKA